jgi:HlyD family secretion protein
VKRWIRRFLTTLFLAACAAGVVYAFLPKPVMVDVARVERGGLAVSVEEDGKTRLRDRYVVSTPLAGRLHRITLRAGDVVGPGQPLAVIEPADPAMLDARALAEAQARVKSAKKAIEKAGAQLKAAEVALELAETEYGRAQQLWRKNSISKADLDARSMEKRSQEEELRTARYVEEIAVSELELAEAALFYTRPRDSRTLEAARFEIPSPALKESGRVFHVLKVLKESEAVVTAGTPLVELGDLSNLEIEIDVLSSDAVRIHPGAKVLLEQWGGDEPLAARVKLVEPSGYTKVSALGVEEQRVNVIADFPDRDKIPQALGDGFRVEAKIIIWEGADVLKVPASALFRFGEGWGVFRVEDDKAVLHKVQIGRRGGLFAQVIEGLAAHDEVIVHPSDRIADGVQVLRR